MAFCLRRGYRAQHTVLAAFATLVLASFGGTRRDKLIARAVELLPKVAVAPQGGDLAAQLEPGQDKHEDDDRDTEPGAACRAASAGVLRPP